MLSILSGTLAQDFNSSFKNFYNLGVKYDIKKDLDVSLSYMSIYDTNPFSMTYYSLGLKLDKKLNKKSSINISTDLINVRSVEETGNINKKYFSLEGGYEYRINFGNFTLNDEISLELNFPKFRKFKNRIINNAELIWKTNWTGLKIKPYTTFRLYYYQGGNYLNYYDDEGILIAKKSPNDIHRWRWYGGLKLRIIKNLNANIAYFWNEEFNANFNTNSQINIYNKSKTQIIAPFNSYSGLNISLNYDLN